MIKTIDAYIHQYPKDIQVCLSELRHLIHQLNPNIQEKMSYQMPTFYLHGNLVHFAVHKHHIGFYPTPSAIVHFKEDLTHFKYSKGAIQFPLHQKLPFELIKKIVLFRILENLAKKS